MIQPICTDITCLRQPCRKATIDDRFIAQDVLDTLMHHKEKCVGMAANMIAKPVAIIVFYQAETKGYQTMFNPQIIKTSSQRYEAEEGCLSLSGTRKTMRYASVKVRWQDENMNIRIKTFQGVTAQIIQHEIDHCNGILI